MLKRLNLIRKLPILLWLMFPLISFAQSNTTWDYPVKPGMEEWKAFASGKQMLDACQIPQKVLNELNTQELADICIRYPLSFEFAAANDEREAVVFMVNNFNGLKELSKRVDGAKVLVQIYKDYPVLADTQQSSFKVNDVVYKLPFLELVLSNNDFIIQLSDEELLDLQNIVQKKYSSKIKNANIYSLFNVKKTFLLGAMAIEQQKNKTISTGQIEIVKKFIQNYNSPDAYLLLEFSKIISEL